MFARNDPTELCHLRFAKVTANGVNNNEQFVIAEVYRKNLKYQVFPVFSA